MQGDLGGWLYLIMDVVLVALLAGGLAYGTWQWHKRSRSPAIERASEAATKRLYEQGSEEEQREQKKSAA